MPGDYKGLVLLILVLGASYIAQGAAGWLQNFWMIGVAQRTVAKLRADLSTRSTGCRSRTSRSGSTAN